MARVTVFTVAALAVLLYSCSDAPHPAHPIAPPQVGQVPPPHPAHPIVEHDISTSQYVKYVWLQTWCGDSPDWCGYIGNVSPPHVEPYTQTTQ